MEEHLFLNSYAGECPICKLKAFVGDMDVEGKSTIVCPECGRFNIHHIANDNLLEFDGDREKLSKRVKKCTESVKKFTEGTELITIDLNVLLIFKAEISTSEND